MERRKFYKLVFAASSLPLLSLKNSPRLGKILPSQKTSLTKESKIGLICPGSPITQEKLDTAIENVSIFGFNPVFTKNVLLKKGYLAGSDQERLDDLHEMFSRPDVSAIWCIRGGYGCTRLLNQINYKLIRQNPKPLIGYSDITALLNTIHQKTKNPCYHGPVASSPMTDYTKAMLTPILDNIFPHEINISPNTNEHKPYTIYPGIINGRLAGGNLSLIAALEGTPYAINSKNKIVFIEDVGEKPYRIDRMLTQLLESGFLKQAAGIILGEFADCEAKDDSSLTLKEVLLDRLQPLKIPTVYGYSFGHIDNQCTLPIGVLATLNTEKQIVTLLGE